MGGTADIELRRVTRRFGARAVLDDVTLVAEHGDVLTILGPSGSGKSTVLQLVNGIQRPDAGSVFIGGEDVTALPPYRRDAHTVFQDYALFPHLSVEGNIEFSLRVSGVARPERRRRVDEVLAFVGLAGRNGARIEQLSGGERQRVALARAVVDTPRCLLLDECLSALDRKLRREMADFILDLKARYDLTILFVTHDQEEALALSTRVAILHKGKVEQVGTPRAIYAAPASEFVARFLGEVNLLRRTPVAGVPAGRTVGVRPEHVELLREAGDAAPVEDARVRVPGKVERVRFGGPTTEVLVALAGGGPEGEPERLKAVVPSTAGTFEPGASVVVAWPRERTLVLER